MKKSVLLLKDLIKEKSGNRILDRFFLEISNGEIVNLIGLEGSGKEEVYAILFGEEEADSGEVRFDGKPYTKSQDIPVELANGIFFIGHREFLIPDLSVAENLYIIERINYFQFSVPVKKMELQAGQILEQFHVNIDPGEKARNLNRYEGYILRLMRAYVKRAKLIVVDDILDDCAYEHTSQIIEILARFKREGMSILWMNSYPDAISEAADRTVVIRDGRTSYSFYRNEFDKERLIEVLIKNEYIPEHARQSEHVKHTYIETGERQADNNYSEEAFHMQDVDNDYFEKMKFTCMSGEILGIYDLQNKFSRELRKLLLGQKSYTGELMIGGKVFHAEADYKLVKNRIGVIDGTKYQSLIFKKLSVQENLEMAAYKKTLIAGFFINRRVKKYLDRIGKEICGNSVLTHSLSYISRRDAVQIIYNRWRLANPKVLFCFQPFLRLDALSRRQLEEILNEFRDRGMGIVLSSVRQSELLPLCDRILVIDKNRISREIKKEEFSENFQSKYTYSKK